MDNDYKFDEEAEPEEDSFNINITDSKDSDKQSSSRPIHKSMIIAELVDRHPDVIPTLIENGMHCIGCGASMFETLEEGLVSHGMDENEINTIVDKLNDYIKETTRKE
jgi:hybrid cluster-associated redox disulfide protein